ncbi:HPP family protein [Pedobacter frigoris]|uniref:HPP family protein n=1 Tax=Pedobacter frigoris TaxID=2571272 RepID=A0A4U1CGH6_9SPHI|nr:HPP family protein [Pedobacter frigoris]TKC05815.1 HPP family protein [Pedobacter frigoris]
MKNYITKFKTADTSPKSATIKFSAYSALGGFIAITAVALLTKNLQMPFIMAPFGATCVLAFGVPDSPLAQPRNIIGGHLISTFIGLSCFFLFGNEWYTLALGVGLAIAVMQLTKTTHPPAGADPLVVILGACHWDYLINPVLSGSVIITIIALLFNNISRFRKYPKYWW